VAETLLIYFGLLTAVFGGVSLIKPLKFLKISSRLRGALVLGLGTVAAIAGFTLPIEEYRIATPRTQLDQFAPRYQFGEFHSIRVAAPRDRVYRAMKMVSADEIPLFRTFTIQQSGFAIAMMNFLIEDDGQGACVISTETRVRATDPSAKRRFAAYWRMIYPGSAVIRRMWLRAIKKRAEGSSP